MDCVLDGLGRHPAPAGIPDLSNLPGEWVRESAGILTPHCALGLRSQWFIFDMKGDLPLGEV